MFNRLQNMIPRQLYVANKTDMTIHFLHSGTTIWFLGSENPDSLYGEDVHAAVIDEGSRVREDSMIAVMSTLTATGGPVRIIGNVKGKRNWFYNMARKAEAGEPDYHFARITAADAITAGVLDPKIVQQIRATMPEEQARQLFDAEAADDEGNPFGYEAIKRCTVDGLSLATATTWGIDFAKSKDWNVSIALDKQSYVSQFHRWNKSHLPPGWPAGAEYWDGTLQLLDKLVGQTPALCDATGLGDPLMERLHKMGNYEGLKFTSASKQQLVSGLVVAIQKQEVHFPAGPIVEELECFEYEVTRNGVLYAAPEGMHDDCVIALALAVQHQGKGRAMSWMDDIPEDDPDWFMKPEYDATDWEPPVTDTANDPVFA